MDIKQLVYPYSVGGHLDGFQSGVIMNKTTENIHVPICWYT